MSKKFLIIAFILLTLMAAGYLLSGNPLAPANEIFSYVADLQKLDVKLYWKDEKGKPFENLGGLKQWFATNKQQLAFAMNAGMFKPDLSPVGLYIEKGRTITPLDTSSAGGNFYLKPNGVLYITSDRKAFICVTEQFVKARSITYATQSGPMLVINGNIHSALTKGSANVQIRNGVGILPGGKVVFAMSKEKINFYDFAMYFKNMGCRDALYLDGFVSRMYLPGEKLMQTDGKLGVIIGVGGGK